MKKIFLTVTVAAFVAVGFTSCKKATCIECGEGDSYLKYCEEDFPEESMGMSWKQWSDLMASSPDCQKVK